MVLEVTRALPSCVRAAGGKEPLYDDSTDQATTPHRPRYRFGPSNVTQQDNLSRSEQTKPTCGGFGLLRACMAVYSFVAFTRLLCLNAVVPAPELATRMRSGISHSAYACQ